MRRVYRDSKGILELREFKEPRDHRAHPELTLISPNVTLQPFGEITKRQTKENGALAQVYSAPLMNSFFHTIGSKRAGRTRLKKQITM